MVMPANQTNELVHLWSGLYGGVGHLFTPARKERARPWLAYALDNGRYAEATATPPVEFDEVAFMRFVEDFAARELRPIWCRWPGDRLYTYVDPVKVASDVPGWCFIRAGWKRCGTSGSGLLVSDKHPAGSARKRGGKAA